MSLGVVYVGLLTLGVVYALLSGVLGWFSDLGGTDVHLDASGHFDVGHPHPISGTTIATFITGFGGGGVLAHYLLGWSPLGSLTLATGAGLVLAAAAYLVLELIFSQTQAGSEHVVDEAVGRDAEIITPIPAGGIGEVAYLTHGQREQASARSVDGEPIPRGCPVVIDRVVGQTVYVRRKA